jgi:hypothetical protein
MTSNLIGGARMGLKGTVGIASCIIGVAVVYFAFGVSNDPLKKNATASVNPTSEESQRHRPVRTMNMALGNMVFFAHDLGFAVKTAKDGPYDSSKIAVRIENQLQYLREIYRHESVNNASLVGGVVLQIHVSPSGEVSQVKEITSQIADADFRKTLLAEAYKWSFADIVSEAVVVHCPLLFVREGMDITTLVQWEKALGHLADKGNPTRVAVAAKQPAAAPLPATTAKRSVKQPASAVQTVSAKEEPKIFQVKYPTALRKDPNFSSTSLSTITIGTKIAVINSRGDWLEVKTTDNRHSGYIRKEFAIPVDGTTQESPTAFQ